ncbi:hypothetical protein AZA_79205 [Nitrospirillum viridazoti Y2]|nr:hypothetical protein AZA_79205 [Nitrospirillum amazonense Y2]
MYAAVMRPALTPATPPRRWAPDAASTVPLTWTPLMVPLFRPATRPTPLTAPTLILAFVSVRLDTTPPAPMLLNSPMLSLAALTMVMPLML